MIHNRPFRVFVGNGKDREDDLYEAGWTEIHACSETEARDRMQPLMDDLGPDWVIESVDDVEQDQADLEKACAHHVRRCSCADRPELI